ncbi:MAG: LLM class flavin-dependent oxidoreductase [Actinomycetota bacterium]
MARAARDGRAVPGHVPSDLAVAPVAPAVPVFIGARGPRLNRLASEIADGVFVAGMPPFRYDEVVGWARSARPVDVALYPSVALDEAGRERHRPEMIWSLLDAPPALAQRFGLEAEAVADAAAAMRTGDRRPATALIGDDLLDELMLVGPPDVVGRRLAGLVREHGPTSIGLALIADDLPATIELAAEAFEVMRAELGSRP